MKKQLVYKLFEYQWSNQICTFNDFRDFQIR